MLSRLLPIISMEEEEATVSPLTQAIVRARVISSIEAEVVLSKEVGEIPDCHDSRRHATTAVGHSHTLMDVQLRENSVERV